MNTSYMFTLNGFSVTTFGHRPLGVRRRFTAATNNSGNGGHFKVAISFPERIFESEADAVKYAEMKARELIDSKQVPDDI